MLVCIAGDGQFEHAGTDYAVSTGDVLLLAAEIGACSCQPPWSRLLEISLPEGNGRDEKARCF